MSETVVVIGGSSGIGLAVARRCLADGATVVIAGRSADRLTAARAELGAGVDAVEVDIGEQSTVSRCSSTWALCGTWSSPRPTCRTGLY